MEMSELSSEYKLETCEMHTCGEPVRILESTEPKITFPDHSDILEKKHFFSEKLDFIRQILMLEPRGHKDMFGVIMTEPNEDSGSDLGILFINTTGYASMCGHASIAIGRYALEKNLVTPEIPETKIKLDCPCGLVVVFVEWDGVKVGKTKFHSVPAFVLNLNYEVSIPELEIPIKCDIVYGGNFYAIMSTKDLKMNFNSPCKKRIVENGISLMKTLRKSFKFPQSMTNPSPFLYGVLITEYHEQNDKTDVLCIFGEESVDRSPCGSGTTAIIARDYFTQTLKLREKKITRNPLLGDHSYFVGTPIEENILTISNGEFKSIIAEISGRAYFVGRSTFTYENDDHFKFGFNL